MKNKPGIVVLAASLAMTQACGTNEPREESETPSVAVDVKGTEVSAREDASFDGLFREAGQEFAVPPALLKSLAFVQTRYQMVEGAEEFEGRPAVHGMMALSDALLAEGAKLAGVTAEQARTDVRAHVRAAAALLSHRADALQLDRTRAENWAPAVGALSGIESEEGRRGFVHGEVFRVAAWGWARSRRSGPRVDRAWPSRSWGGKSRRSPLRTTRRPCGALAQLQRPAHGSAHGRHPHL
ncbi:hypothetical protein ACN28S_05415 [Cystobacter fuscus]